MVDPSILRSAFSQLKRGLINNPPGPSKRTMDGTHGGELIAYGKYLSVAAISPDIIHSLTEDMSQIRFAACHLRLKHTSIIVFTVYLWDSQGWSAENHTIMQHIKSISDIFDVPIVIVGDFNMLPTVFNDSCWRAHLKV